MSKSKILLVDAIINLLLAILLLIFTNKIVYFLGVPSATLHFYPNILGAVLFGIGIALMIEYYRKPASIVGLGLGGAVAINLCGGIVLAAWLMFGNLHLPIRGKIFLWVLAFILLFVSGFEIIVHLKNGKNKVD
jgi:hypothetical protein